MLVDSHCHLDRLQLDSSDGDLDRALDAARSVGVEHFLCVGIDRNSWPAMLDCVGHREDVSCSVGVHPNEGDQGSVTVGDLLAFAAHGQVVAIGETGLDYHYGGDRRRPQQETFRLHVEAARLSEKPLIVHSRAAKADTLEVLREACAVGVPGVLHCFTEDWDMARQALDLGYYISFSGIVTFRSADELREVAQRIPLDGMLLETDSPWLAPVPNRGKPNQPAWVREVAACIAALRGIALEELAEATTSNFFRLFGERQATPYRAVTVTGQRHSFSGFGHHWCGRLRLPAGDRARVAMSEPRSLPSRGRLRSRLWPVPGQGLLNGDFRVGGWVESNSDPRPAAVLVPLVEHPGGVTVLLTRRTDHLHHHPGQVSFPGGQMEAHDQHPLQTAVRETQEEIGLDAAHIEVIGYLDPYQTVTGFRVTPVVAMVEPGFSLAVDRFEVAEVFEVPLQFVLDPANHLFESRSINGQRRRFYVLSYRQHRIWGATAAMLVNLYQKLC